MDGSTLHLSSMIPGVETHLLIPLIALLQMIPKSLAGVASPVARGEMAAREIAWLVDGEGTGG